MQSATGSAAPIGDMMIMVGNAIFGAGHGRTFMLVEAFTVFLAIIGTTLSCMSTGARVTYAMGKDEEVPDHFGLLHAEEPDPASRHLDAGGHFGRHRRHRGLGGVRRRHPLPRMPTSRLCRKGFLSSFGYTHARRDGGAAQHPAADDAGLQLRHVPAVRAELRHLHGRRTTNIPSTACSSIPLIPIFGLVAILACMIAYLALPFMGIGTKTGALIGAGNCLCMGASTAASTSLERAKRKDGRRSLSNGVRCSDLWLITWGPGRRSLAPVSSIAAGVNVRARFRPTFRSRAAAGPQRGLSWLRAARDTGADAIARMAFCLGRWRRRPGSGRSCFPHCGRDRARGLSGGASG